MAGAPGRSGGKRPGAGRPVESRTLRTGQTLLLHERTADGGFTLGEMVEVEIISRTKFVLHNRETGDQYILGY